MCRWVGCRPGCSRGNFRGEGLRAVAGAGGGGGRTGEQWPSAWALPPSRSPLSGLSRERRPLSRTWSDGASVAAGASGRVRLPDQILQHREPVGHLRFRPRPIRPRRANAAGALLGDGAGRDQQVEEDPARGRCRGTGWSAASWSRSAVPDRPARGPGPRRRAGSPAVPHRISQPVRVLSKIRSVVLLFLVRTVSCGFSWRVTPSSFAERPWFSWRTTSAPRRSRKL